MEVTYESLAAESALGTSRVSVWRGPPETVRLFSVAEEDHKRPDPVSVKIWFVLPILDVESTIAPALIYPATSRR
jgi:hypothetical protein